MYGVSMEGLEKAIALLGGQSALGRALGIKQQLVWNWLNRTRKVPAEYAIPIEKATDGRISRHQIRPDLYPIE